MDLELCRGAQARGAQLGRASIDGPWLRTPWGLAVPFAPLRGPTGYLASSEHPQERAQPSFPAPAPLGLGTTSSLCPGILASDFPIFPPGMFLHPGWGAGWGNAAPPPAWASSPISTFPPRPRPVLPGPMNAALLCSSTLLPLPAKQRCRICPGGCMRGEPGRERQYLLPDQLRWFRKGDKLLGTRVLLSAHKLLFSSAISLAS